MAVGLSIASTGAMERHMIDELIKQAPYLGAIVIIVFAFLRAQAQRDTAFLQAQQLTHESHLKAQAERDRIFLDAIKENNIIVSELTKEIGENTKVLVAHDSSMRVTAENLIRTARRKAAGK